MEEPIRVLHILQRMEAGGTQALLMNLYRNIDRKKIQFDFLVVYKEKQFYDEEINKLGGRIYRLSFREDLNLLKFIKDLKTFFQEHNNYKIVHCHAYTIGYFCLRAAKKVGINVRIAHSHSNAMTNDIKKYLKKIMQKLFILHATDLFACSEEAGKYLFHNKTFNILKNAIESSKFISNVTARERIRKELGISDSFVIGHVGRFKPEKNHKFWIDIFAEIKKQQLNSKLLIIGNGDPSEEIKKYIYDNGYINDVIIMKNRKDVNILYQAMDLFIFPSKYEGLGIVAIEAQTAGIPVLVSTGVPIETKITPLYDRISLKKSAKAWAEKGLELSNNNLSHTNMQKYIISSGYDINATVNKMEEFYLSKINKKVGE